MQSRLRTAPRSIGRRRDFIISRNRERQAYGNCSFSFLQSAPNRGRFQRGGSRRFTPRPLFGAFFGIENPFLCHTKKWVFKMRRAVRLPHRKSEQAQKPIPLKSKKFPIYKTRECRNIPSFQFDFISRQASFFAGAVSNLRIQR